MYAGNITLERMRCRKKRLGAPSLESVAILRQEVSQSAGRTDRIKKMATFFFLPRPVVFNGTTQSLGKHMKYQKIEERSRRQIARG